MTSTPSDDLFGSLFTAAAAAAEKPRDEPRDEPRDDEDEGETRHTRSRSTQGGDHKRKRSTMCATMDKKNKKEKLKRNMVSHHFAELHAEVCPHLKLSDKVGILSAAADEIRSLRLALKNMESAAWDFALPVVEDNPSLLDITAAEITKQAILQTENEDETHAVAA